MQQGDKVTVSIDGKELAGELLQCSPNGRSLVVTFEEGVPAPFALYGHRQALVLLLEDSGKWSQIGKEAGDFVTYRDREILVRPSVPRP